MLSLYAQGYTLAELLVQTEGKHATCNFSPNRTNWAGIAPSKSTMDTPAWMPGTTLAEMDRSRMPKSREAARTGAARRSVKATTNVVVRSQTPDEPEADTQPRVAAMRPQSKRLVAPRPKVAGRPRRPARPTTVAAAAKQVDDHAQPDSRYSNDGWIAIRTPDAPCRRWPRRRQSLRQNSKKPPLATHSPPVDRVGDPTRITWLCRNRPKCQEIGRVTKPHSKGSPQIVARINVQVSPTERRNDDPLTISRSSTHAQRHVDYLR